MRMHVEARVFEVSALIDPARVGRWLGIDLWDKSGIVPRLLCGITIAADVDVERQVRETAEHLVRWLVLDDVDDVQLEFGGAR